MRKPTSGREAEPTAQGGAQAPMRLDKFLKVSRIIKRRTVANDTCDMGRVTVNGREAKASTSVKVGDVLEMRFGERVTRYEILSIKEHVVKQDAAGMYRILES